MIGFVKQVSFGTLSVCKIENLGELLNSISKGPMVCVSINNQTCKSRPRLVNINTDKTLFDPVTVTVNKCGESCNTIDDVYSRGCVPNKIKNMNVKIFNLMSGLNETNFLVQHESCECKCRLNKSVCNSKQV